MEDDTKVWRQHSSRNRGTRTSPELDDDTDKDVGVSGENSFEVEAILTLEKHSENSNNRRNSKNNRITWPAH